jgi:hypothetical protein
MHANTYSRRYSETRIYTDLHCFGGFIALIRVQPAESAVIDKCRLIRAKSDDHFECIMQNKANFPRAEMNAKGFSQRDYESKTDFAVQENKPNQSQSGNRIQKTEVRRQGSVLRSLSSGRGAYSLTR